MADKRTYVAQWQIQGLGNQPLNEGDTISLEPDQAAPFLELGCLKLQENRGRKPRQPIPGEQAPVMDDTKDENLVTDDDKDEGDEQ